MNRTEVEKQLADLKRANKTRKLMLAVRNGYKTIDEYKIALETILSVLPQDNACETKPIIEAAKVKNVVKPKIHNVTILDNSGSMRGSKFDNAYRGINNEIKELQNDNSVEYTQTFCHFESSFTNDVIITHRNVNIHNFILPDISTNAGTPLYKSIVEVCNYLISTHEENTKVLLQIFTDGEDVHSYGYKLQAIDIIRKCKNLGITVTFVGTKDDVKNISKVFDIDESNTLVHDNTGEGVKEAFKTRGVAMKSYSEKVIKGEEVLVGFYKSF